MFSKKPQPIAVAPEVAMRSTDQLQSTAAPTAWRLQVIMTCLFFGNFLIGLDINIINVALPRISAHFDALNDVAWYGSAYLLTITACQPLFGAWYRVFRTDIVYRISIVLFELGSILCAAAPNSVVFILGRAIAGFGAAGVLQGALSTISLVVPLDKRPLYIGIAGGAFVVTVTAGPVLGGVFTQKATWRWCFWINVPIGALVLVGLTFFLKVDNLRDRHDRKTWKQKWQEMDFLGCILFLGAVVCLLLAMQWGGQTKPWNSPDVIGCFVGAGTIGIAFAFWQYKAGEKALIPLRVLSQRSIWTGGMTLFFLGAQLFTNVFFLSFWLQGVKDQSPLITGVDFIILLLPQLLAIIIVGAIVKQIGHYVPFMVIGEVIAIAGQAMLSQLHIDTPAVYWGAGMAVTGIGLGMAMQLPYTAVATVLSEDDVAIGNALAVLFWQLGGAIFIAVGQTVTLTTLLELVPKQVPEIPIATVIAAGAANLKTIAPDAEALSALKGIWNEAVVRTMYLAIAAVALAVPFTLGMEWMNAVKVAEERKETAIALEMSVAPSEVTIASLQVKHNVNEMI